VKSFNDYAQRFGPMYARTPKAVFAAIAYSFADRIIANPSADLIEVIKEEWNVLHDNGIVPQKPPSNFGSKANRAARIAARNAALE
jgi:hypothetical protein